MKKLWGGMRRNGITTELKSSFPFYAFDDSGNILLLFFTRPTENSNN